MKNKSLTDGQRRGPLQDFLDAVKLARKEGKAFVEHIHITPRLFDGCEDKVVVKRDDREVIIEQVYSDATMKQVFDKWLSERNLYTRSLIMKLRHTIAMILIAIIFAACSRADVKPVQTGCWTGVYNGKRILIGCYTPAQIVSAEQDQSWARYLLKFSDIRYDAAVGCVTCSARYSN